MAPDRLAQVPHQYPYTGQQRQAGKMENNEIFFKEKRTMSEKKGINITDRPHQLILSGTCTIIEFELGAEGLRTITLETQSARYIIGDQDQYGSVISVHDVTHHEDDVLKSLEDNPGCGVDESDVPRLAEAIIIEIDDHQFKNNNKEKRK